MAKMFDFDFLWGVSVADEGGIRSELGLWQFVVNFESRNRGFSSRERKEKANQMGNTQTTNGQRAPTATTSLEVPPPPPPLADDTEARQLVALLKDFTPVSDFQRLQASAPPIEPPPHVLEAMVLRGDFDLDLSDPDLASLLEDPPTDSSKD